MNKNLNNRYGNCCNCPAFMEDQGRIITNYMPSKQLHTEMMKKFKLTDSNQYRMYLQENGLDLSHKEFNSLSKCTDNDKNKFYLDKSKYTFNEKVDTWDEKADDWNNL